MKHTTTPATLLIGIAFCLPAPEAAAGPASCSARTNNTTQKLLECVTLDGVRAHQQAFQEIAEANAVGTRATRATGFPGYDASVAYVQETLEAAGYAVTLDPFDFTFFAPVDIVQTAPVSAVYESGAFSGSGFGAVTDGPVIPVDLSIADPAASSSGCEAADFAGLDFSGDNDIALVQRGTCFFSVKALNAEAAGAEAVIIMNQGTPGREGLVVANAANLPDGSPSNIQIPVVGASFGDGVTLSAAGSRASITVVPPEQLTAYNVLAELPGDDSNVVMVGAHLDSVQAGPGVQDNGSGSAAILEVALQMAKVRPRNTVRFAWWGGEESGLIGSTSYVAGLSQEKIEDIALYLNFDMIGSPNYVQQIYDGDDSDGVGAGPGPDGSAQIEALFEEYYTIVGEPFRGTDFDGRSDYGPFIAAGIPAGGLFTGAEVLKTPDEVLIWGGVAGQQYDPCYHLACDTFDNINLHALEVNSGAVAYTTLQYAMNTETINGVRGKGNFQERQEQGTAMAAQFGFWGPRPKK